MSEIKFTKMQGLGNDYIYIDLVTQKLDDISELSIKYSDRHFGIGGDGIICILKSDIADFKMEIYNADGSKAEMCGNGIRCVGKFVYDKGLTEKENLTIETDAGLRYLTLFAKDGKVCEVKVDMGEPVLTPNKIPVLIGNEKCIDEKIEVLGRPYKVTCVSMGNPHAVTFVEDTKSLDLEGIGPYFENHKAFPKRINTEFIKVLDRKNIEMRVWERGSGETMACGTGACASAVASFLNGYTERDITVHLRGGDLKIFWDEKSGHVYMTGPAVTVFEGTFEI